MFTRRSFVILILGTIVTILQANAQTTITGTVKSTNGGVLQGAKVSLALLGVSTQSGSDGKFTMSNIASSVARGALASPLAGAEMSGSRLYFVVANDNDIVSLDVFTPAGNKVQSLLNGEMGTGQYCFEMPRKNLAAGIYVVRLRIGNQSHSFVLPAAFQRISGTAGLEKTTNGQARLAKQQFEIVDTIVTELAGYYRCATPIPQYSGDYTVVLNVKPAAVNTKIYSERSMAQIDWGKTEVDVWDNYGGPQGTQLNGAYPDAFEGANGWQVVCGQGWSTWVFKSTSLAGVDMSAFAGGSLHVAIKGSAPSVGMFVSSIGEAKATTVDLDSMGYKNDGSWHEMSVPLANFGALDLSQVGVYAGFSAPADSSKDYAAGLSYVIDDLYFKPK